MSWDWKLAREWRYRRRMRRRRLLEEEALALEHLLSLTASPVSPPSAGPPLAPVPLEPTAVEHPPSEDRIEIAPGRFVNRPSAIALGPVPDGAQAAGHRTRGEEGRSPDREGVSPGDSASENSP